MGEVPGIKNAFPLLDEFYRKPEYTPGDSQMYNIKNRFYPDEEPIPNNLPPTYNLPKVQNQKCANCIFFHASKNHCKKWKALGRIKKLPVRRPPNNGWDSASLVALCSTCLLIKITLIAPNTAKSSRNAKGKA